MTARRTGRGASDPGNEGLNERSGGHGPAYATRYIAVDSHLTERDGSTEFVSGLAGERPAGRKLAQDIANACNQLYGEGYEVISIVPLISGRTVEATVEAEEPIQGRTFSKDASGEVVNPANSYRVAWSLSSSQEDEPKHYVDTGVGYSVTDGVLITAKRRGN